MKKFSNRYIFIYITILVVIVAVLLALAAVQLKPLQDKNKKNETYFQILNAAGYFDFGGNSADKYNSVAKDTILITENKDTLNLIIISNPKEKTNYIIPLRGKGLWGPIWGYIAVADDGNTIEGAIFAHKSETPGLGAEITTTKFANQFKGKLLFDENDKFVSVKVVKGGTAKEYDKHAVDGISGGTITSNGVDKMIYSCLEKYVFFLKSLQKNKTH